MLLSAPKTKYKIFYNAYTKKKDVNVQSPPTINLYNEPITPYEMPIKYLGFYLSHNLSKIYHINCIIQKTNVAFHTIRID